MLRGVPKYVKSSRLRLQLFAQNVQRMLQMPILQHSFFSMEHYFMVLVLPLQRSIDDALPRNLNNKHINYKQIKK